MTKFSVGTTHMQAIWRTHCQLIIAVALGLVGLGLAFFGYLEMSTQPGNSGAGYRITIDQGDSAETNHIFSASDNQLEQIFDEPVPGSSSVGLQFGYSVAFANANLMAIGSVNPLAGSESGEVYIFEKDGSGNWQKVYEISASDEANTQLSEVAGSKFGYALDFNGSNVLAIGVPDYVRERGTEDLDTVSAGAQLASGANSGAVYIFSMSGSSWQTGNVSLAETVVGAHASRFGSAVAFSSNGLLAVGATGALTYGTHLCGDTYVIEAAVADSDDYDGDGDLSETVDIVKYFPCGQVVLLDYDSSLHNVTVSTQQLPASNSYDFSSAGHDGFGGALAFSPDNLLAVGSSDATGRRYGDSDGSAKFYTTPGAAFLFSQNNDGAWQADLKIADVSSNYQAATPVADLNITLTGDCIYETDPNDATNQICKDVPGFDADFGKAVTFIDADTLAVGSDLDKVLLFSRSANTWAEVSQEISSDLQSGHPSESFTNFGRSLDYEPNSGLLAISSSVRVRFEAASRLVGAVNLVDLTSLQQTTAWHYVYIEAEAVCAAGAFTGVTPDDYSEGAEIEAVATNENQKLCFRAVTSSNTEYHSTVPIDLSAPDLSNASLTVTADGVLTINFGELVRRIDDSDFDEDWAYGLRYAYRLADRSSDTNLYQNGLLNDLPSLISISSDGSETIAEVQLDTATAWPADTPTAEAPITFVVTVPANFEDYANNVQTEAVTLRQEITAFQTTIPRITITFDAQTVSASDDVDGTSVMTYRWLTSEAACDDLSSLPNPTAYPEGSPIRLEESHNGQQLCFSSTDSSNSLVGYQSGVIRGVDRTPPEINIDLQLETIAISTVDQGSEIATRQYVILSDRQCSSSTDFNNAITYDGQITIIPADHAGKYFCFRVTDTKGNPGYAVSGAVGTAPVVTGITINQHKIDFNRIIIITVSFSEAITHDSGTTNAQSLSIRFNSQRGGHVVTRFKRVSGNQVIFEHRPQHGDYTPGIETATTSDDEYFDVTEIVLGDDSLSDSDGNPAILAIPDAVNISATRQLKVDLRVPTITVTNPTDLTTVAATRTFRAVDDWTGNEGLTNNGYSDFFKVYVFEYYFVPAALVDDPANSVHNCRINGFFQIFSEDQRFSYQEGTDVVVTDDYNDHHICFRSRRPGDEFVGGKDNFGFVGVVSALIQNLQTPKPTVSVTAGSVTSSFKATDDYSPTTDWVYQLINATTETCDKSLNWTEATSYDEGTDVAYTAANNGQRVCFRAQDTTSSGSGYGASIAINLESVAPTIVEIRADSGHYGEGQVIIITVTFSEEVILSGGSPILDLDLPSYPTATYLAQPSPTTMTFSYTVTAEDDEADLNLISFNLNGSTIRDSAQNDLNSILPNLANLAATSDVTLDNQPPTVQLSSLSPDNDLSATADDNHDDSVELEFARIPKADSCDTYTGSFEAYQTGTVIGITEDEKACFRATDAAGNSDTIGSLPGNDITPPTIVLSDPGTAPDLDKVIVVSTPDLDPVSWLYKLFDPNQDTCEEALMSDAQPLVDFSIVLGDEANNGQQVCLAATDSSSNTAYQASVTITGIDTSRPRISLTYVNQTIVVAVSDASGLVEGSLVYALIAAGDSCDQASIDGVGGTAYTDGTIITITDADIGSKFCFAAEDNLQFQTYQDTKVIAADNTAPEITVTSPDTSPAQTKLVRATSADADVDDSSWVYKLYHPADDDCDLVLMGIDTIDYLANSELVLDAEDYNRQRVCFSVRDNANNPAYQTSEIIGGIDRTPPTITITGVSSGYLRASDDDSTPTSWRYLGIGAEADCQTVDFSRATGYREASSLALTSGYQGQRVCLMVSDLAGNSARAVSEIVTKTVAPQPGDDDQTDDDDGTEDDQPVPSEPERPTDQSRPTASEISDLSGNDGAGGSSALTLTIGLTAVLIIIVLITRSRRSQSRSRH